MLYIQHFACKGRPLIRALSIGKQKSIEILPCTTPSLYTAPPLEPDFDLTPFDSLANKLFRLPCKYIPPSDFQYKMPANGVPEFAFIGRSNVGKSSLIDSLLSAKGLVRISKEPGCTKSVNYFAFCASPTSIKDPQAAHSMYFVDLPGYGFAKASKEDKSRWKVMTEGFFKSRDFTVLRRVYVLIDSRHGIKASDCELLDILNTSRIPYQIVLTKSDLCSLGDLMKSLESVLTEVMHGTQRHHCIPFVHVVSSRTGFGIQPLKQCIAEMWSDKISGSNEEEETLRSESDDNSLFDEEAVRKTMESMNIKPGAETDAFFKK